MSEQKHPWCRDVSRDEAIRAAEDAAAAERTPLPDHRDLPAAVADLRRRVEGLETVADHWRRQCEAAADAENREAAPASREGVTAAPAANAGGVSNPEPISGAGKPNHPGKLDSSQEPVAWGVRTKSGRWWNTCFDRRDRMESCIQGSDAEDAVVSPLYAAPVAESATTPQPPRGWITDGERRAVEDGAFALVHSGYYGAQAKAELLRALLARETPPKVRRPHDWPESMVRDLQWIAAIREAGGEVAE